MSALHVSKFGPKISPKIGQAGNTPVLALLHGWGSSSKIWQSCIEKLVEEFEIYCVDLPGHGKSQNVEWDKSITQGLSLLANALPDSCHLVGWSLGGLFAQLFVKHYPQRVNSLMLVASTPKFIASTNWPHAMPSNTFRQFSEHFKTSPQATLKQFRALQVLHSSSAKEITRNLQQASSEQYPECIAWGLQWLQEIDLRDECIAKHVSLRLLQGENDQVSSVQAAEQTLELWQAKREKIKLCKVPAAGHTPFLTNPELFYQQICSMANH